MRTFLLCAFLMIILYPVGIDLYLVAVPRIAESLQANEAQIHTAFSTYLFGMAATVLLGGMIADRYGRRPVVLGGAIIFLAASLVAANATDVIHFYLGRFWQGVGAGSLYIMTFTVLRDVLSKELLAMALSMINGVICVIPVLAPVLGYLILSRFAWQGIFVVMALVAALTGLVNMVLLKETRPASSAGSDNRLPFELLRSARFMLLSLLTSASVTAILVYVSVSPLILMQELGFSPEQYSVVMMVMAGVSMSTSFLMPLLLRRLGKQRMLAVSHLAYLLAALLLLGSWLRGSPGHAPRADGHRRTTTRTTHHRRRPPDRHHERPHGQGPKPWTSPCSRPRQRRRCRCPCCPLTARRYRPDGSKTCSPAWRPSSAARCRTSTPARTPTA